MAPFNIDLNPVTFITVDAIGQPGERVFTCRAEAMTRSSRYWWKIPIQTLALAIENLMMELQEK